jgi:large subunit ribosomal protein L25
MARCRRLAAQGQAQPRRIRPKRGNGRFRVALGAALRYAPAFIFAPPAQCGRGFLQPFRIGSDAMAGIVLNVERRERTGTGGARASRRAEKVPGVLYGGARGPVAIDIERKELIKALRSGKFVSHMVTLRHQGEDQPVIPKAIQYDPVTDLPLHIDLYRVEENSVIDVDVPVHFKNQEICPGLKKGGTLNVELHTVKLKVLAGKIPEEIMIDLATAEIGHVFHINDITLPDGAKPSVRGRNFSIATLIGRGGKQEDDAAPAAAPADSGKK